MADGKYHVAYDNNLREIPRGYANRNSLARGYKKGWLVSNIDTSISTVFMFDAIFLRRRFYKFTAGFEPLGSHSYYHHTRSNNDIYILEN